MGRLTNEEKAAKNVQSLIETIAKIDDLEPTLGGKWKSKMLDYYVGCLANLILYQSGFSNPSFEAKASVSSGIYATLFGDVGG